MFLTVEPTDVFGELALLDDGPRSTGARTSAQTTLVSIGRTEFREALASQPALVDAALRHVGRALRRTTDLAADLALLDLPGRLAKLLASAGDLHVSQSDLAAIVGGSRQSVNQALRALERAGLVEVGRGHVFVRDAGALARVGSATDA